MKSFQNYLNKFDFIFTFKKLGIINCTCTILNTRGPCCRLKYLYLIDIVNFYPWDEYHLSLEWPHAKQTWCSTIKPKLHLLLLQIMSSPSHLHCFLQTTIHDFVELLMPFLHGQRLCPNSHALSVVAHSKTNCSSSWSSFHSPSISMNSSSKTRLFKFAFLIATIW